MNEFKFSLISLLVFLLSACGTQRQVAQEEEIPPAMEFRNLDTLFVSAPRTSLDTTPTEVSFDLPVYRSSSERTHDLLHTRLDLRFDWEREEVIGEADLLLQPYFYPSDHLVLDAKGFEVKNISLLPSRRALDYQYDGTHIDLQLDRTYSRGETYEIQIEYVARPTQTGGSSAITSDQGLFFIKPTEQEPEKPRQIWTQGETEWNSRWFPTIDHPNERCTQEIFLTVDERFTTLSNGILISSVENEDGSRTDYWKLDQPHAPYLFMVAVGEYAVVREKWRDIPVEYYVEPAYEKSASAIFSNTVPMLEFFSEKTRLDFPWPKYAQIIVRDFVSGAMENTTAVTFMESLQRHRGALIDNHNEDIIAHELFHHWFGDYVTCESWANLTMNEGFATYGEYLWYEHRYGRDEADYHLLVDWANYLTEARADIHPLIHFEYEDAEDMFDRHSYSKGGAVLHMLRYYVGDEAFWASLNLYLKENAYSSVEAHDLRLAFEEITGEDLNWFFNQWYFRQGHPELNISHSYEPEAGEVVVDIEQVQDPDRMPPVFRLPSEIAVYLDSDRPERIPVILDDRKERFRIKVEKEPRLVLFDPERILLMEMTDEKEADQLFHQYHLAPSVFYRLEAIQRLDGMGDPRVADLLRDALQDSFYLIRMLALDRLDFTDTPALQPELIGLANRDPHAQVRATALQIMSELGMEGEEVREAAVRAIRRDSAFTVNAAGLFLLNEVDSVAAFEYAKTLEEIESDYILDIVGGIYSLQKAVDRLDFFEKRLREIDGYAAVSFYGSYQSLLLAASPEVLEEGLQKLMDIATEKSESYFQRIGAAKAIADCRDQLKNSLLKAGSEELRTSYTGLIAKTEQMIKKIIESESDPQMLDLYRQLGIDVSK